MDKFLKSVRCQLKKVIEAYSQNHPNLLVTSNTDSVTNQAKVVDDVGGKCEIGWVVGNEAADLDSVISCLGYSFLHSNIHEQSTDVTRLLIPLINIPRGDLELRPEVKFVFDFCKFPTENLFFIDDPLVTRWEELLAEQFKEANTPASLLSNFILMDHNKLHRRFETWKGTVKAIYDHHQDEKCHLDANPRVIKPVGSNTSLIVEWWQTQNASLKQNNRTVCSKLAYLMLAPILVDTVNLKGEYGRVTNCDLEMAAYLNSHIDPQECLDSDLQFLDNDDYFNKIDQAKTDVSHMNSQQLLRKDFKLWVIPPSNWKLGMSSIVNWCYAEWQERGKSSSTGSQEDPFTSMSAFAYHQQLDVLVVLGFKQHNDDKEPRFEREFYVYSTNSSLLHYLHTHLLQEKALGLEPIDGLAFIDKGYIFYSQTNLAGSRKVSYPILSDLLASFNN